MDDRVRGDLHRRSDAVERVRAGQHERQPEQPADPDADEGRHHLPVPRSTSSQRERDEQDRPRLDREGDSEQQHSDPRPPPVDLQQRHDDQHQHQCVVEMSPRREAPPLEDDDDPAHRPHCRPSPARRRPPDHDADGHQARECDDQREAVHAEHFRSAVRQQRHRAGLDVRHPVVDEEAVPVRQVPERGDEERVVTAVRVREPQCGHQRHGHEQHHRCRR